MIDSDFGIKDDIKIVGDYCDGSFSYCSGINIVTVAGYCNGDEKGLWKR